MKTTLLTALAAAALAAGCSKSDTGTPCVKIAPTIQTRVTGLHFDTGDRIGLSIAKGSETYAQNVPMTYDGTAFTAADLLWYNDSNEKSTLTAYHPYSEQGMPAEFSVATDQTSGGASSDLLVAVKKEVTPSSAPVGMLFYHVMSQLTIVLTNNSDAPVTGVTVGGLVPTAVVDFTVPSAAAKSGAAAADVEAFEVTADAAYRAILVPQQATLTVTVATGDGKSRSKTLSSAQLESGKRYDMSVVVTNIDIDVELSGEVVDWGDGGSLDGGGDGGGFAAGKGREVSDADVADEVPVGGAGKGVDIRGLNAEETDERLLLVGVVLILKRLENIARVAAASGQQRNEVRFGKKLLKARGNGSGSHNCSPCKIILLPIVSHNGA